MWAAIGAIGLGVLVLWLASLLESWQAYTSKVDGSKFHRHTQGLSVVEVMMAVARRDAEAAVRRAAQERTQELALVA